MKRRKHTLLVTVTFQKPVDERTAGWAVRNSLKAARPMASTSVALMPNRAVKSTVRHARRVSSAIENDFAFDYTSFRSQPTAWGDDPKPSLYTILNGDR